MKRLIAAATLSFALLSISPAAQARSFMAWAAELVLRVEGGKKTFSDPGRCEKFLQNSMTAEKPFTVPKNLQDITGIIEIASGEYTMSTAVIAQEGASSGKAVLYVHGGAYVNQITSRHWKMLGKIAAGSGACVYVPDYPLSPAHTWEETYALVEALYGRLMEEYRPQDIVLMGDSAGGGFVLAFAEYLGSAGLPAPGKIVAFSPWMDLAMENPEIPDYEASDPMLSAYGLVEMGKCWAGGQDLKDCRLSPIYGTLESLDNVYLFVGTREIFYPDVVRFHGMLEEAGKDATLYIGEGLNHVYPVYPIPEARKTIDEVCRIINM